MGGTGLEALGLTGQGDGDWAEGLASTGPGDGGDWAGGTGFDWARLSPSDRRRPSPTATSTRREEGSDPVKRWRRWLIAVKYSSLR